MKQDYDQYIDDVDEVVGTDIKINPEYYIHNAIIKAQAALSNPDIKAGFLQFRILVENIEILCRSAKLIAEDYEQQISNYKKSEDFVETKGDDLKGVKIANKKMELLMSEVFSTKVITNSMKLGEVKKK